MLERPQIGAPAPDIELEQHEGDIWSLAQYRGRVVVVTFHRHIH